MQLIYYSHSYRQPDGAVNEFFQELMVDEGLTPSLDPKADGRLNAAKPERHLRSTDAMVAVLTWRDTGASPYILWEIGLGMRSRKPQLILIEDTLPDDLVPAGLLQRRFSRRRLLRESRDHRQALRVLAGYVGKEPPPSYQPASTRRSCVLLGASQLRDEQRAEVCALLEGLRYRPVTATSEGLLPDDPGLERTVQQAPLCVVLVDGLTSSEYYLLGIARAALTPTVLLTLNQNYEYRNTMPREYQPHMVSLGKTQGLVDSLRMQIEIFEEDYLDLVEEQQVKKYQAFQDLLLRSQRNGASAESRRQIFNFMGNAEVDMSSNSVQVTGSTVGSIVVDSAVDRIVATVRQAPGWSDERREELEGLMLELKEILSKVKAVQPEAAERLGRSAELVVTEATKEQPDRDFLSISVEGLKQAAKALKDIAPDVLLVAGEVAAFIAAI